MEENVSDLRRKTKWRLEELKHVIEACLTFSNEDRGAWHCTTSRNKKLKKKYEDLFGKTSRDGSAMFSKICQLREAFNWWKNKCIPQRKPSWWRKSTEATVAALQSQLQQLEDFFSTFDSPKMTITPFSDDHNSSLSNLSTTPTTAILESLQNSPPMAINDIDEFNKSNNLLPTATTTTSSSSNQNKNCFATGTKKSRNLERNGNKYHVINSSPEDEEDNSVYFISTSDSDENDSLEMRTTNPNVPEVTTKRKTEKHLYHSIKQSRKNANSSDLIKIEMLKMQQQRDAIEQQRNSIELQRLEFEMEKESRQKSTAAIQSLAESSRITSISMANLVENMTARQAQMPSMHPFGTPFLFPFGQSHPSTVPANNASTTHHFPNWFSYYPPFHHEQSQSSIITPPDSSSKIPSNLQKEPSADLS